MTSSGTTQQHDPQPDPVRLVYCRDLTHEYNRQSTRGWLPRTRSTNTPTVRALSDISLDITAGEVVGIQGPSGSGKSTLLHVIAGLAVPTSGHVELAGMDLTNASERARTRHRRRHIGFIFQRFHLLPSLSARANVALPLIQLGIRKQERRKRAETLLNSVGLGDRTSHTPGALSGGEQQRVAIARALITDPDVVLADEPTGELDTASSERVLDVMLDVAGERAVIVASHDDTALAVTDRVLTLRDGRLVTETDAK